MCQKQTQGFPGGQTWSPVPKSSAGHFVSLAHILHDFILADSPDRIRIELQLTAEMMWFHELPVRPPLREKATMSLEKTIKKLLEHHERGVMTDNELVGQITAAFAYMRYPTVSEMLDLIKLIPEPMLKLIRAKT